jgi:hypothetical protein
MCFLGKRGWCCGDTLASHCCSLPCLEGLSPGSPVFLPPWRSTFPSSNSTMDEGHKFIGSQAVTSYPRKTKLIHLFTLLTCKAYVPCIIEEIGRSSFWITWNVSQILHRFVLRIRNKNDSNDDRFSLPFLSHNPLFLLMLLRHYWKRYNARSDWLNTCKMCVYQRKKIFCRTCVHITSLQNIL